MPLKLTKRKGSDAWYIRGTVKGKAVFETAGTETKALAEQKRAAREAELYEERALGRRPAVAFIEAASAFLEFETRGNFTDTAVRKLADHFGRTSILTIKQSEADAACAAILKTGAAPATKVRLVYTPLTSVLNFAARRGWCDPPRFEKPKMPKGKTAWITPAQAQLLIATAAPHLAPLLRFMLSTGARVSEALELQWADVDFAAARTIFRNVKSRAGQHYDRVAALPPAAIVALANIPFTDAKAKTRAGHVFLTEMGQPYEDRKREMGGQIKTAFARAAIRAGLATRLPPIDPKNPKEKPRWEATITPHDLRHSWATWFYAASKDLLLLKDEGAWRTLAMVERYAHLMPANLAGDIHKVWGASHPRVGQLPVRVETPAAANDQVG